MTHFQDYLRAARDAVGIVVCLTIVYAALWAVWGG